MTAKKIITHCAPTLAGIKTANLFNEPFDNKLELFNEIKHFNKVFKDCGLNMIPLSLKNNHALIYVYRISELRKDFDNELAKELLNKYGYDSNNIIHALRTLISRMKDNEEFPHEIGLFLGYPPLDVKGFIDNHALNYKLLGYWKAYSNVDKAMETFKSYNSCKKILLDRLDMGYNLKQLVIQK